MNFQKLVEQITKSSEKPLDKNKELLIDEKCLKMSDSDILSKLTRYVLYKRKVTIEKFKIAIRNIEWGKGDLNNKFGNDRKLLKNPHEKITYCRAEELFDVIFRTPVIGMGITMLEKQEDGTHKPTSYVVSIADESDDVIKQGITMLKAELKSHEDKINKVSEDNE